MKDRNATPLDELMSHQRYKEARLTPAELVALRLYSGPMFVVYNGILRRLVSRKGGNQYTNTLHLIVSGIVKLQGIAQAPLEGKLYRGFGNMALPADFFREDEQGYSGGVEIAFMSTTEKRSVANRYSGAGQNSKLSTIFVVEPGQMSLGASISWLSQFTGEDEILYPPLTHMAITGHKVVEIDGNKVAEIYVKLTCAQGMTTVEQATSQRKDMLLALVNETVGDKVHEAVQVANGVLSDCDRAALQGMRTQLQALINAQEAGAWSKKDTWISCALIVFGWSDNPHCYMNQFANFVAHVCSLLDIISLTLVWCRVVQRQRKVQGFLSQHHEEYELLRSKGGGCRHSSICPLPFRTRVQVLTEHRLQGRHDGQCARLSTWH